MSTFVAIDFETANQRRDSACAIGLAVGCEGRIVALRTFPIRPPTSQFAFTRIHGLCWDDVRVAPTFGDLWPALRAWIDDAEFIAAHNAPFDRSVLHACCARYRLRAPRTPFTCTIQLARAQWRIYPTKLPDVCRQLRIPLRHHDSGSDAEACAHIVLAAEAEGWRRRPSPPSSWGPATGFPTVEVVAHQVAIQFRGFAARHHCQYTRYADDITFSRWTGRTSRPPLPKLLPMT